MNKTRNIKKKVNFARRVFVLLFVNLILASVSLAQSTGSDFQFLSKDAEKILGGIQGTTGFSGMFSTLFKYTIYFAAVLAILELIYYGAKYAIVDSFTGKKLAKENIVPITMGLAALLGTYVLFNTLNPQILSGELTVESDPNAKVTIKKQVNKNNNPPLKVNDKYLSNVQKQKDSINKIFEEAGLQTLEYYKKLRLNTSDINAVEQTYNEYCDKINNSEEKGVCKSVFGQFTICTLSTSSDPEKNCEPLASESRKNYFQYLVQILQENQKTNETANASSTEQN